MRPNGRATLPPHAPCSATAQMRWSVCAGPCSRPRRGPRAPHQAMPRQTRPAPGVPAVFMPCARSWRAPGICPSKPSGTTWKRCWLNYPMRCLPATPPSPCTRAIWPSICPGRGAGSTRPRATGLWAMAFPPPSAPPPPPPPPPQRAAPDRPVVCLIGDGGLQFTLPELASAVEAGLAPIILLWNNGGYEEIRRYMRQRDIRPIGVDLYTPDFQLLARGFGCDACRADDAAALRRALRQARSGTRDRPVLIETSQAHWHAHAYAADRQTATTPPGPLHGDTDA